MAAAGIRVTFIVPDDELQHLPEGRLNESFVDDARLMPATGDSVWFAPRSPWVVQHREWQLDATSGQTTLRLYLVHAPSLLAIRGTGKLRPVR